MRIWNVARSEAQIQAGRTVELTSGTGLIGRYGLNEGSGTTAASSVAGAPNGHAHGRRDLDRGRPVRRRRRRNAAPTVALNSPADAVTGTPTSVTLSATGSDTDTASVTVTFFGRVAQSGNFAQIATFPGVAQGTAQTTNWTPLKTGLRYEWYATVSDGTTTAQSATRTLNTAAGTDPVLVGAGDIADCNSTGDEATGALISGIAGGVYTTGDNVYVNGTAAEFANCYEPTLWGGAVEGPHAAGSGQPRLEHRQPQRLLRPLRRTGRRHRDLAVLRLQRRPVLARHRARQRLRPRRRRLRGRLAAAQFLVNDLAANSARNVIAMWHHPRYSSSSSNATDVQPFVDALHAAERRPHPRRPRSRLRALRAARGERHAQSRTAFATSRSAPAARAITRSAPSGPAARSAMSPPTACCGSCCARRPTTGSSSPSPASPSPTPARRRSSAATHRRARPSR